MKKSNLYLIGFMGSGKSSVCSGLSHAYHMADVDTDAIIVSREGTSINDIFSIHGETYFRDCETALLQELSSAHHTVISCGGGIVLRAENVKQMKENGIIILLTATPENILKRVKNNQDRPILNGHMNVDYIRELMEKRRELYEKSADLIIRTDEKSVAEICREIHEKAEVFSS